MELKKYRSPEDFRPLDPQIEFDKKVREYKNKHGVNDGEAMVAVAREYPTLAKEYISRPIESGQGSVQAEPQKHSLAEGGESRLVQFEEEVMEDWRKDTSRSYSEVWVYHAGLSKNEDVLPLLLRSGEQVVVDG